MNTVRKFQKRKEDFICEKCAKPVKGDGFTDHCPYCLWSKHVDIFPGDRLEDCGGLMEPVDVISKSDYWVLEYKCTKCGYMHKVRASEKDDSDAILALARKIAERKYNELMSGN